MKCHSIAKHTTEKYWRQQRTAAGTKIAVEWDANGGNGNVKNIKYHVALRLADAGMPLDQLPFLRHLGHRAAMAIPGAAWHCRVEDMAPEGELRLQ